jgi:hypothetical protein
MTNLAVEQPRKAARPKPITRCSPLVGFCTVRTEDDIIGQALRSFAEQLDLVVVVDCGSTDETVPRVMEVCEEHDHVVFLGSVGPLHARQIRRDIWGKFRNELPASAWWIVADADEFIDDDLTGKVARAEAELADHIFSMSVNFYYTAEDHEGWLRGEESLADRQLPIEERRRHYRMQTSQRRFFRNLPWLRWNRDESFPENLSAPASERIIFRHYQYRDPEQIRERIAIRSSIPKNDDAMKENSHWHRTKMEDAISTDERVICWETGEAFVVDPEMPPAVLQPRWKSLAKYSRAIAQGFVTPQHAPRYFQDIDAAEVVARMKSRP